MKVLFVLEHFYPHVGGGEKLCLDLAEALVRKGIEVRVVTSGSGGVQGKHTYNGIEIFSYSWPSFFGHPIPKKNDIAEHIAWPDVIQTAQYTAAPAALSVARKHNKPCVFMAYEFLGGKWYSVDDPIRATVFRLFEWWVFHKQYQHYIAISHASERDLIKGGISEAKASTIYPVYNDFSMWRGKRGKTNKQFLYYGRPGKTKGIFTLIEAINMLQEKLPKDFSFCFVVSDDPLKEKQALKTFINEHGLKNRVEVVDSLPVEGLKKRIANSYCVIVPSLTEGFGYSAYQAACMQKNMIVSNAGSLPEVISGNCIVFKKGDVTSLAEAITDAAEGKFQTYKDRIGGDNSNKVIALYESLLKSATL